MTKPTAAELKAALKVYMKKLAAKGARLGGKARMAKLTPEERSALGRAAITARWTRVKAKRKKKRSR